MVGEVLVGALPIVTHSHHSTPQLVTDGAAVHCHPVMLAAHHAVAAQAVAAHVVDHCPNCVVAGVLAVAVPIVTHCHQYPVSAKHCPNPVAPQPVHVVGHCPHPVVAELFAVAVPIGAHCHHSTPQLVTAAAAAHCHTMMLAAHHTVAAHAVVAEVLAVTVSTVVHCPNLVVGEVLAGAVPIVMHCHHSTPKLVTGAAAVHCHPVMLTAHHVVAAIAVAAHCVDHCHQQLFVCTPPAQAATQC